MGTHWTFSEIAFVRGHITTRTHAQIAAVLGRSPPSVKSLAKRLGITKPRRFTADETAFVCANNESMTAREIAARLGRSEAAIFRLRARLGLCRRLADHGATFVEFVAEKHRLGWSDCEVASGWTALFPGCHPTERHSVSAARRKLGLGSNQFSEHMRQKAAARTAEQLRRAGHASIGMLRVSAFRKRAHEAGWPDDLRPRAVQILNAIWERGPMTRREIADAIGMPWKGSRASLASNDPEGSYLAHLVKRKLIVVFKRACRAKGVGKSMDIYSLAFDIERRKTS